MRNLCGLAAIAALAVSSASSLAQSAGASTRLQVQSPNGNVDRTTPGTGSSTLQFASDQFNNGIVSLISSSSAGGGSLSTFASAACGFDTTPFVDGGNARASASMTDSLTVRLDGSVTEPVTFNFAVHASGSVTFDGGINTGRTGSARSEYAMTLTSSSGSVSASGAVVAGRRLRVPLEVIDGLLATEDFTTVEGLGFDELQLTLSVLPLTEGQTLSLSMTSVSFGSVVATDIRLGSFMNATADFGSTLRWMGVTSATLPDGSPYTGGYSITSLSGFDYSVPTPGAGLALGLAGIMGLRRSARPGA